MTPMNTLIKFSDALCHPVSARRPTWPRGGFVNTTREQLAEIGRAFASGDKRTLDQACEELKATSLGRLGKTVSRNAPLNSWKEMKGSLISQRIFNSNTCRILFATCLSALCLAALSAEAATITVMNTNDSGAGSLRQALMDANEGDTIDFGVTGTITLTTGQLVVDKSVSISGPGAANLAVNSNAASRVFHITNAVTVSTSGLTITNGSVVSSDVGGGAYNDQSTLTVSNCTLSGNSAGAAGGIDNDGRYGGATLTINNSTLSGNSVNATGGIRGAILNDHATITIGDTILNTGGASGENIYNAGTITSNGYNLSNDNGGGLLTGMGDQINTDPMLGPLQDNGGPTFTHALLTSSPAIDAGDTNF